MNRQQRRQAERQKGGQRPTSVSVGVPHRGVTDEFFDCWSNLLVSNQGLVAEVITVGGSLVAAARNTIVRRALAGAAEWVLQLDADMSFEPDLIVALLAHADATDRPIVGGLAFKVHRGGQVEPTMYRLQTEPATHLSVVSEWQDGALVEVDATGAACLLVHRSVYEKLDDGTHSPWFDDADLAGERIGEDISFCLRARRAGFPVYVATAVEVGHVKSHAFGVGEWRRQRAELDAIPSYVVVPVRDADDPVPVASGGAVADVWAVANTPGEPVNLMKKWNRGLEWARGEAAARSVSAFNVLILNDDVVIDAERVIPRLSAALRADPSYALAFPNVYDFPGTGVVVTSTNDPGSGQTFSGWALMVKGESALPFDDRYPWWYGDSAYEKELLRRGRKVVMALDCRIEHLHPNEATFSSPALLRQAVKDEALFAKEWDVDPATLFLARNPELVGGAGHVGKTELAGNGSGF